MPRPEPSTPPEGATSPTRRDCKAAIRTGYWFEAVCFKDAYTTAPELLDRVMLATPEEAVRLVRIQIRTTHPFALSPAEVERALAWAGGEGRVHALAALHRGEPAGFGIMLRSGLRAEWRVLPVRYLGIQPAGCSPEADVRGRGRH
ncbi:hypothetical protein AB0F11_03605 [Streptomyces sp. NPDC032472]|uniref:hypothetical protein n=1 Tax=Streptomyces sp. NPDC032472 TaxID=3155018 RepID=UPI0033D23CD3